MERRLGLMHADGLVRCVEYIVRHQSNRTVGKVKQELGLNENEYEDLFDLAMPTIRANNEALFWKNAYQKLHNDICGILAARDHEGIKSDEETLDRIREIALQQSEGIMKRGE